eukprot:scaffold6639_cov296-Prasinococcus_capsulatus_cf.AAC.1
MARGWLREAAAARARPAASSGLAKPDGARRGSGARATRTAAAAARRRHVSTSTPTPVQPMMDG